MPPSARRPGRRSIRRGARFLAAVTALAPVLSAAQLPRTTVDNTNAWFMYFGDHGVGDRWAVHAEGQVRRADGADRWQQLLLRPGVIYALSPAARVAAGYAYVDTWPYGEQPAAARFPEHRAWQQLQLAHGTGRVAWQHRYRIEQRWVGRPLAAGRDWTYTNRARYLARVTVPLSGRTVEPGSFYASAYDELFVSWGRNVQRNLLDQNRLYGAVGLRATRTTRVEAGYMQQYVLKGDGVQAERNHTLQLGIFQSAAIFR